MATSPSDTDNKFFMEKANQVDNFFIQLIVNHAEKNTVNLVDIASGLKFEGVPQYIQIEDYIYNVQTKKIHGWDEKKSMILEEVSISDGEYTIKDGEIIFNEILHYSFKENSFILDGYQCVITPGKQTAIRIDEQEIKAIEDLFEEMIKKPAVVTPAYTPATKQTPVTNSYYDYYKYGKDQYTPGVQRKWDYEQNKFVDVKPAENTNTNNNDKLDEDDKIIIEYYNKSLRK
jgi:hypothetical protein